MATKILAGFYLLGQDNNYPRPNLYSWNLTDPRNQRVNAQGDHASYVGLLVHELII
jgi:beta-glucosidase